MTSAAADLATIGSNVSAAHMVAAARTTAVIPAAADEVSASIAHVFSQHAASYQAMAGQAAAFNGQFVQHLTAGACSYTDVEAALTAFLQNPMGYLNSQLYVPGAPGSGGGLNPNVVNVLALLELPFLIPFLIVTAPVWLPLLIVVGPFLVVLAAA
jgi:hypothetical protein